MFCSSCGKESKLQSANYCFHCGNALAVAASNVQSSSKLSFSDFKKRKEEQRQTKFTNAKKAKLSKPESLPEVQINIGVKIIKDGQLSIKKGTVLPLKISPNAKAGEIKEKGVEKHHRFSGDIVKTNTPCGYKLIFRDNTVVDKIPEKDEDFVLKTFKDELGKPYSRISFYLVSNSDYVEHISQGFSCENESSDGDGDADEKINVSKTLSTGSTTALNTTTLARQRSVPKAKVM